MSLNDFVHKYRLKNKATSNVKIYDVLKKTTTRLKSGNLSGRWTVFKRYWRCKIASIKRNTLSLLFKRNML